MSVTRNVALVGRPNVGKSRLFNRLAGKRISIVHDQPGVTRDVMEEIDEDYILMDTGGINDARNDPYSDSGCYRGTSEFRSQAADLVLFVVDAKDGMVSLDSSVADKLRKWGKIAFWLPTKVKGISMIFIAWASAKWYLFQLNMEQVLMI